MNNEESLVTSSVLFAFILPIFLDSHDYYSPLIFISLAILIFVSIYFTIKFFKSNEVKFKSILYFMFFMFSTIIYFALLYKTFGIIDSTITTDNPKIILNLSWINSLYFSVVTWTTLGYGDFRPHDSIKYLVIIEAMIGYVFMSLLTGKFLYFFQKYK